jgi:hypothetical protein
MARTPGPDTLRVRLTLTGVETSTPVLSTVTRVTPAGLVLNAGLAAADKKGTFSGSVSYAVELSDASTGELLNAYVTNQSANALNVVASFGPLDAARGGVRAGADQLRDKLDELGVRKSPGAQER